MIRPVSTHVRVVLDKLDARFKSGNSVPVPDVRLTLEEFDILRQAITNVSISRDADGNIEGISG